MGTISDKLERVLKTKKDIQNALVKNGKYVPDKLPFKYYPYLIDNMNIDGLVGMYYGKGLTNEELSKDPTWYDTSGNGNDLKFKNLAWKLNSGAGIYVYDFTRWNYNIGGLTSVERTGSKIQFKAPSNALTGNVYDEIRNIGYNYNFKIRVTGLKFGNKFSIRKGASSILMNITQDGIYHVNTIVEEDWDQKTLYIFINSIGGPDVDLIVEQIPDYEGAICFNGIDDCAVCDNFPILTKEKGYTVMALRKWLTPETKTSNEIIVSNIYNPDWSSINLGAFNCEVKYNNLNPKIINAISYSSSSRINIDENDLLFYQTSNNYNGNIIEVGNKSLGGSYLFVGSGSMSTFYANSAIYALCVIDHDTSDAERQIVINKWKQYYPELFPDQAWTVTGKTNEDEDRATVKNLTGNGNDLMLSNFAFAGDSGYGLYGTSFVNSFWIKDLNLLNTNSFHFTIPLGINSSSILHTDIRGKTSNIPPFKINVSGLENIQFYYYYVSSDNTRYGFRLKDGVNNLPESYIANLDMDGWVGFGAISGIKHEVTIEQIPDYEGYLVTDGVDDKIQSSSFELDKDWTIIGDWMLLQDIYKPAGMVKSDILYVYNNVNGMVVYLKSSNIPNSLSEIKSLYAVCSDGRVYDNNWNEHQLAIGEKSKNISNLIFGVSTDGTKFTKTAFKNSAIYNGKVLTKDQCIKAYNYLQTLKEK